MNILHKTTTKITTTNSYTNVKFNFNVFVVQCKDYA